MPSRAPGVSVIVPTYNRAELLPEAVRSILGQTYEGFELIVVDDGSTDATGDVVAGFSDPRIRYIRRARQGGISAAMNAGIAEARAELIARLDSDDVWLPEFLAEQTAALADAPEAGFVYARATPMNAAGEVIPGDVVGRPPPLLEDSYASILLSDCTCNITIVARRDALEEAGPFDESLRVHEDWDI